MSKDIDKLAVYALVRTNLSLFVRYGMSTLEPHTQYIHAEYIDLITHELMVLLESPTRRLVVNVPPRHLKSLIVSVFYSAWLLGHHPHLKLMCISYSPDLATQLSKATRQVMESDWYRVVFPGAALIDSTQDVLTTSAGGWRRAFSVGGAITGFGADVILIDDPQKADDVLSPTLRQKSFESFKGTIATRLNDPKKGAIVLIQQRLHEGDWSGMVLEGGNWSHLSLPAIAEHLESIPIAGTNKYFARQSGDLLNPGRLPKSELDKIRNEIGDLAFETQYQQRPGCPGGNIVDVSWFERYDELPTIEPGDVIMQSWDVAITENAHSNFSVCSTCLYKDGRLYLMEVWRKKMPYPDLRDFVPQYADVKKADVVVIEAVGAGQSLWQELYRRDPRRYLASEPKQLKEIRLMTLSHYVKQGRVWIPKQAPWLDCFLDELRNFPNGKYDDQVDSFSQALRWLQYTELRTRRT